MARYRWKELFPPHIWQRGVDYYRGGHILDLHHHGNMVTAEIEGTDVYTVSVTLDTRTHGIVDYACDCPYGEDGTPCKHLAALLCAVEDDALDNTQKQEKEPTIEQAVALLSERQMRELLIQFAQNDSYIREKIQLTATKQLPRSQKSQWMLDLQELTDSATDRHGYIDYEEAYDYCFSLQEYLEDRIPDLLDGGLTEDAFDLTCLVFQTGMEQDMDDSDGGLSIISSSCMEAWSHILELSDLNTHREMFEWFAVHYSDYDLGQMFLEDYIFDAPWNTELAPELMQFLDRQFQMCLAESSGEYRLEHLIAHRIRWMERSGADKSEIDEYMTRYHQLPAIREMKFSQVMQDKDYDTALALLEESKELDKDKIGLVAKYSERKIEIYEIKNDTSALRKELEYYVFAFRQDDLVFTEKLKALLTPSEWEEMRGQLLDSKSMYSQIYLLLAQEGMYKQLMERIEASADIYSLERYESILKKEYTQRCMNVYITYLRQAMSRASNRKAYWSVIQTLKKLWKYPDGKAIAQKLADSWKQQYPRRSSMMDELRKAGF